MKKSLILNADDFGLTPGITAGILYAYQHGILTSTTVMVNTEFAKESLAEAKHFPNLGIGLHFVLDFGKPISANVNSLVDQNGDFLKGEELIQSAKRQDIKKELQAQLDLLYKWNGQVTHIDSHHHMHLHIPEAWEAVMEIGQKYKLPVRTFTEKKLPGSKVTASDYFHYDFYGEEHVSLKYMMKIISEMKLGVTEVMCHPAFLDPWLMKTSSYNLTRMKELGILVDNRLKQCLQKHAIELINYGGLRNGN
ncbi:carbohydrate deacetylase [Oceanobacillus profundus]|uniref:carbohydrate deacetylase n=1 Tax=Oceanobacillus profundus TaxID=372463 RepID=UPI000BA52FB4|nr:carbohydrate deacetylase [Oceanobacillus profundus]MBR3119871.1 carbohydrate deacetylase [Oceanobacillus sp.]MCM3397671.1 carbohydrate deacetylase [Oceanobacillus profundus]PAE27739.1 carbohydrate deacetylase [Paenibacillus sp. 7884-2]